MRAAVAVDGGLVVRTVDDPVPAEGQVLVASLANGICGSDLSAIDATRAGGAGNSRTGDSGRGHDTTKGGGAGAFPVIPGHEFCAEVVDHGPAADDATRRKWPVG